MVIKTNYGNLLVAVLHENLPDEMHAMMMQINSSVCSAVSFP